jgi:hypothetical protein
MDPYGRILGFLDRCYKHTEAIHFKWKIAIFKQNVDSLKEQGKATDVYIHEQSAVLPVTRFSCLHSWAITGREINKARCVCSFREKELEHVGQWQNIAPAAR